jgi:hypothetical protein
MGGTVEGQDRRCSGPIVLPAGAPVVAPTPVLAGALALSSMAMLRLAAARSWRHP